jgi:hypothetical protein
MENTAPRPSVFRRMAPAVTLALLAPLIAEVLPGATRLSAIFVFPVEVFVWGIGAVLIREIVRRKGLGWPSLLALALVLALAEECLIQQTSLAPLVIQLKGEVYARAFGVNYLYLLWALVYESVFVVFLPILLAELLFPARRLAPWLSRAGIVVALALFAIGAFFAWFSWTQIARTQVFHLPPYTPPLPAVLAALAAMLALVWTALGPAKRIRVPPPAPPPSPWLLGGAGAVWAMLWYGLCLLAFGIAPHVPPAAAIGPAVLVAALAIAQLPRFTAHPGWGRRHAFGLFYGTLIGAMGVSFIGFIGAAPADLWFKVAADAAALLLLGWLGARLGTAP